MTAPESQSQSQSQSKPNGSDPLLSTPPGGRQNWDTGAESGVLSREPVHRRLLRWVVALGHHRRMEILAALGVAVTVLGLLIGA